jgi:hypothetical protein
MFGMEGDGGRAKENRAEIQHLGCIRPFSPPSTLPSNIGFKESKRGLKGILEAYIYFSL